jgi:hypothetical protein
MKAFRERAIKLWLENVNDKSEDLENAYNKIHNIIKSFDDESLIYLISNNMYSGVSTHALVPFMEDELKLRGKPYDIKVAEELENEIEPFL